MEINITPLCNHFNKRPNAWLDTKNTREKVSPRVVRGRHGKVLIDEKFLPEFFVWLSDETKQLVLDGKSSQQILQLYSQKEI